MMPLKLIERVLPWLIGSLNEEEAKMFLRNMQFAGSYVYFLFPFLLKKQCFQVFFFVNLCLTT